MLREEIKNLVRKAIKELYDTEADIRIDQPENNAFGDYSTNVAMALKKNPQEIADAIKSPIFGKIEIKNGFINFFVAKEYLQKQVGEILKQKGKFGNLKIGAGQKINVEFISANPTGQLHIGHGRGAFFGDVLANLLEKAGYKVVREYYINDAKASNQIQEFGKTALNKGTTYLTPYVKEEILKLRRLSSFAKKIGLGRDDVFFGEAGYLLAQEIQKDIKNFIEKKLKIKFDKWTHESSFYLSTRKDSIGKVVKLLKEQNLTYLKDGAIWVKTSKYGEDNDWVVQRSNGLPTYLLSDIIYHKDKFDRGFDKIINIWGADHQGHVGKIKAVANIFSYKGDLDILISQVVRLRGGLKLSKRKGQIITLEELINEVGLDTAKFFYLTKSLNTQMEFDLDLAKEQSEKNPVFYIQYAHARICAILRKSGKFLSRSQAGKTNLKLLNHESELNLIKRLIRLPEIINDTAKDYQVQRLPQYATDLAVAFHQLYRDCQVISEDKNLTQARLVLVLVAKIVLKNTLDLMGISAPERM